MHGKDIEKHKTSLTTVQTELEGVRKQLGDANTQIDRLVYALYELTEAEIEYCGGRLRWVKSLTSVFATYHAMHNIHIYKCMILSVELREDQQMCLSD